MSLESYFNKLIEKVEGSSEITNQGKDENGFYFPTRSAVLQQLHLLRDLHAKPSAKVMVKSAWQSVVEKLPPEWLTLTPQEKAELKKILE